MAMEELSPVEFAKFRDYIYATAGICLGDHKRTLVSNRIRRRLKATNRTDFGDYYKFLVSPAGRDELPSFLDEITTNETYFFRDRYQYDWLKTKFLAEVVEEAKAGKRMKSLDFWSAASSTGEEPYSIAMSVAEGLALQKEWRVRILGTDLSNAVLAEGGQAIYDDRSLQLVTETERRRYFDPNKDAAGPWAVKSDIKKMVTLQSHNLLSKPKGGPYDCIFIKNVLIYFDDSSRVVVVEHLLSALKPGGYLVVGPSEGIFKMLGSMERVQPWLYRKPMNATGLPTSVLGTSLPRK